MGPLSQIIRVQGQHCPMAYTNHENGLVEDDKENPVCSPIAVAVE